MMITADQIRNLTAEYFLDKEVFLVDVRVRTGNVINVFIDGEQGVKIDDCVELSRFIEGSFDREVEDFELSVSTAGVDQPLKLLRQYPRNVGRSVEVTLADGTIKKGKLTKVNEDSIEIEIPTPKKKLAGEDYGAYLIDFKTIKGTKVMISFK